MSNIPAPVAAMLPTMPFGVLTKADGTLSGEIVTPPVRVSWLAVDKLYPSKKYPTRPPEASVGLIIPPGVSVEPFNTLVRSVAVEHFGAAVLNGPLSVPPGMPAMTVAQRMRMPLRSQADMKGKPGFSADGSGFWLRAGRKELPRVIDGQKRHIPNDSPALYAGMWVRAVLKLYAYPGKKNMPAAFGLDTIYGINVELVQLQKIADDERITSGAADRDDAFGIVAHAAGSAGAPMQAASSAGINWGAAPDAASLLA